MELSESIKKTFGADMAESFAECEKIYEKARFSRLEITKEEMTVVKNFAGQAKKPKSSKARREQKSEKGYRSAHRHNFSSGSGHKGR